MSKCNYCGKNYFPGHYCVPLEKEIKEENKKCCADGCDNYAVKVGLCDMCFNLPK